MNQRMNKLLLVGALFITLSSFASTELSPIVQPQIDGIEISEEWKEYTTMNGVKIEYRMKRCESETMRAQNLLLFRFTNTTNKEVTVTWKSKEFRNGDCWNCERIDDSDFFHVLTLAPNEVLEGDGTSKDNKEVYVFGNYINLVPGMWDQTLTNFEFADLTVR